MSTALLFYCRFIVSHIAILINPVLVFRLLLGSIGQIILHLRAVLTSNNSNFTKEWMLISRNLYEPFSAECFVVRGGVDKLHSHSWHDLSQRFALDCILTVDADKQPTSAYRSSLYDYASFGHSLYAPMEGEVVKCVDRYRDYAHCGTGEVDWLTGDFAGNHLVIRHDTGLCCLLAHLKKDSIKIRLGDKVARGELVAECGNSGISTQPHVHIQLQEYPIYWISFGVPIFKINNNSISHAIMTEEDFQNLFSDRTIVYLLISCVGLLAVVVGITSIWKLIFQTILNIAKTVINQLS